MTVRRPHPALQVHGTLSRGALAVTVLVSLAVLFAPGSDVPSAPPGVDKVVHLTLFLALVLAGRWAGVRPAPLVVLLLAYGAVSEVVQALAPLQRSGSVVDWLADAAGVVLGVAAWAVGERRSALR
ncbi:VanZ family protein [Geodermatophilus bullaregiensis]|uniref:VanZ family protein n=1 Tax=Geodermatophilus bullaregiensis TaxID=1564160 RepID=UPI001959D9B8|nr:VanZ family protein [Geodermatophilus bullaregiensis]MBM7805430.1 VanZ family protein [Geodermatophilus bullaregiensis]